MKNILFLILICVIKLSAYEYKIYESLREQANYDEIYLIDRNQDVLTLKYLDLDREYTFYETSQQSFLQRIGNIKRYNGVSGYISVVDFNNILESDLILLNDFYIQQIQTILNYYYNESSFDNSNYIEYSDYQILYNSDGLAVESIVNGEWAGLYSDSQKSSSGYLYDSGGTLIYYNGEKVSWIQSAIDKVLQGVIGNLYTLIRLISTPVGICVSVVFVLCLAYYVVEVGRRAIKPYSEKGNNVK